MAILSFDCLCDIVVGMWKVSGTRADNSQVTFPSIMLIYERKQVIQFALLQMGRMLTQIGTSFWFYGHWRIAYPIFTESRPVVPYKSWQKPVMPIESFSMSQIFISSALLQIFKKT
jgi:hypothetical protein